MSDTSIDTLDQPRINISTTFNYPNTNTLHTESLVGDSEYTGKHLKEILAQTALELELGGKDVRDISLDIFLLSTAQINVNSIISAWGELPEAIHGKVREVNYHFFLPQDPSNMQSWLRNRHDLSISLPRSIGIKQGILTGYNQDYVQEKQAIEG